MFFINFNHFLLFLLLKCKIVHLYIVIPLKSTNTLFFSNFNKGITINNNNSISEIYTKWVNNTLFADLLVGEPNQLATSFLSTEEYGFTFYEEFSTNELKQLNVKEYNEYIKENSNSIVHSNELNYNFSFWEYLSYEEPLTIYKFNDNEIFSYEMLSQKIYKTKSIHFLYAIRHSSKVFNTTDFINFEKNYQESKNQLRKLNYTSFSYFCIGLQLGGRRNTHQVNNIVGEFFEKNEINSRDWSIYFIDKNKGIKNSNNYIGYLILGSSPYQYLSDIYTENEAFSTDSENEGFDWTFRACLSFYKTYIKIDDNMINLNKYQMKAKLDFNFEIIKGTWNSKTLLEQYFFTELMESGKCFESKIDKTSLSYYHYFYCDKNKITKKDLLKFPKLYFHHIELSMIFELTYEDLFETFGDVILFKIVFDTSYEWTFGKIFLKKYMFSYNDASKKIYFYNKKYSVNENEEKNRNISFYIEILIIIILVFIFGFLGFYIGKKIYKKYNKDANELEDFNDEQLIKEENTIIEMITQ